MMKGSHRPTNYFMHSNYRLESYLYVCIKCHEVGVAPHPISKKLWRITTLLCGACSCRYVTTGAVWWTAATITCHMHGVEHEPHTVL